MNHVEGLIRDNEFPGHRADMQRVLNVLTAFHRMFREDFVAGLHHDIDEEYEPFTLSMYEPDISPAIPSGNAPVPDWDYDELVEAGGDLARRP